VPSSKLRGAWALVIGGQAQYLIALTAELDYSRNASLEMLERGGDERIY
jgi:hypothetical protein